MKYYSSCFLFLSGFAASFIVVHHSVWYAVWLMFLFLYPFVLFRRQIVYNTPWHKIIKKVFMVLTTVGIYICFGFLWSQLLSPSLTTYTDFYTYFFVSLCGIVSYSIFSFIEYKDILTRCNIKLCIREALEESSHKSEKVQIRSLILNVAMMAALTTESTHIMQASQLNSPYSTLLIAGLCGGINFFLNFYLLHFGLNYALTLSRGVSDP